MTDLLVAANLSWHTCKVFFRSFLPWTSNVCEGCDHVMTSLCMSLSRTNALDSVLHLNLVLSRCHVRAYLCCSGIIIFSYLQVLLLSFFPFMSNILRSDRQSSVHASSFNQNTAPVDKTASNKTTTCIWCILSQQVRHRRNLSIKICLVLI